MNALISDLRFAVRVLLKSPGFAVVAVLCLAIGIGANTTIFSVVNAVLLRPFPFADPDRIVAIHETQPKNDVDRAGLSYLDYRDLREQSTSFAQTAAYTGRSITFSDSDEPERVVGGAISASLFPLLGVKPALGRHFREDEDQPGAPRVVLLSDEIWKRRFNGDPAIVGKTLLINAAAHTVVGVMPPRFQFPESELAWIPLTPIVHDEVRALRSLAVLARLKRESGFEQGQAEVKGFVERLAAQNPDSHKGWSGRIVPLREEFSGRNMRLIVLTMMGAVICVLLIACSNVANLLLARATVRQREIAVRAAFGAGRVRLLRQLLTESVVIGLLGGGLGVFFAIWGLRWMELSIPTDKQPPFWIQFKIDGPVLLFTLGIAVVTGLFFGLAPALQAMKTDLHETLKEGGRGVGGSVRRNRLRSILVVIQVAFSLLLLIGASLFVRSFLKLQEEKGGLRTDHVMTMRFYMPAGRFEKDEDMTLKVQDVVRRLETIPGVEAVSASNNIPLGFGGDEGRILVEGQDFPKGEEPDIFYSATTPHLFQALDLKLTSGRTFTEAEGYRLSGVAVVNKLFAQKFWPGQEAVGHRFRLKDDKNSDWIRVIGVAPDFKNGSVNNKTIPAAFLPYAYGAAHNTGLTIRTRFDPPQVVAPARKEIRAADPSLPVFDVYTLEQIRQSGYWEFRLFGGMFTVFGAIALFLAAIGLYGVLTYSVSQRVREIGVRVALGAQGGDVLRLVIRQGMVLALVGIGAGLLLSFGATRVLASILFDTSPTDLVSFSAISALLAAIAAFASYLPARRALGVDPLESLRSE
ncbi:MAG TPA: ABC transporter permease [Thermoanaerobaculia bacterium]|jgi:predicted permease|nr:ABC transporter permease [Thermoanaerobaculia bacterium]